MTSDSPLDTRSSGVLLHLTSLPGPGIGTAGDAAHRFVEWLAGAGQSYWQVLPLVAVDEGGSPYNGLSAMAGNPLLIDLERLAEEGLLEPDEVRSSGLPDDHVDYPRVSRWKEALLRRAHAAFRRGAAATLRPEFDRFREQHADWLDDYALFRALRERFRGAAWTRWDPELRDRDPAALARARRDLEEETELHAFQQFLFERQWRALREHAHSRGIRIIGDIPIFVAHDSADVWAHRDLFELEDDGEPRVVSGVPPDYFSETGQRWGNPLYRWEVMRERGYRWWLERFRRTFDWVDLVRLDHFRGFEAYWEIPASEESAVRGSWQPGPGQELFQAVERELGRLPVIAEDLGLITPEVEALRDQLGLPGMRVLQFAFDGEAHNPHLPENYPRNAVVYTGTHDNDTTLGWWSGASASERERARDRMRRPEGAVNWELMEMVFRSRASLAVVPLQDVLGLGSEARMNTPGRAEENWSWRLGEGALDAGLQARLLELTRDTQRLPETGEARGPSE